MKYSHDAIVIGAGSAGLTAAGGIAMFGRKVALIEAGPMGGECLNTGCVPSKALIAAAARAHEGRRGSADAPRFGVALGEPQVDWRGVHGHIHEAIATIAPHDSQERFEGLGCEVLRETARFTGRKRLLVGNREITAPRIVIATGSKPALPPIDGLEEVPFLTNESLFDLEDLPEHLIIIGAGAIGMEMAQAFRRLGSEVTVVDPGEPMGHDDRDAVALVIEALKNEGVRFIKGEGASVSRRAGVTRLAVKDGPELEGSHLLIAAGRTANIDSLELEKAGVEIGKDGIVTDGRRRTANKAIYAIGDCRAGPRFTHVAGYEGSNVALEIALGIPARVDYTALPWCTYTSPECAQMGMTEGQARDKHGDAVSIVREEFNHNDRAVTEGDERGFLKVVMKGRKVLGVTIVGRNAGELLLPWTQVMTGKSSTFALGSSIIAYPTRSEIAKAAAFSAWEPTVFGTAPRKWSALIARTRRIF